MASKIAVSYLNCITEGLLLSTTHYKLRLLLAVNVAQPPVGELILLRAPQLLATHWQSDVHRFPFSLENSQIIIIDTFLHFLKLFHIKAIPVGSLMIS